MWWRKLRQRQTAHQHQIPSALNTDSGSDAIQEARAARMDAASKLRETLENQSEIDRVINEARQRLCEIDKDQFGSDIERAFRRA